MQRGALLDDVIRQIDEAERAFETEKTAVLAGVNGDSLIARRAYLKQVEHRLADMHETRRRLDAGHRALGR